MALPTDEVGYNYMTVDVKLNVWQDYVQFLHDVLHYCISSTENNDQDDDDDDGKDDVADSDVTGNVVTCSRDCKLSVKTKLKRFLAHLVLEIRGCLNIQKCPDFTYFTLNVV